MPRRIDTTIVYVMMYEVYIFSIGRDLENLQTVWLRGRAPCIEEGRATSKSPHSTFGYFLSISADIIQNSAVETSPQKQKEQSPFLYILKYFAIFYYGFTFF
jgi:hypothetical protein